MRIRKSSFQNLFSIFQIIQNYIDRRGNKIIFNKEIQINNIWQLKINCINLKLNVCLK